MADRRLLIKIAGPGADHALLGASLGPGGARVDLPLLFSPGRPVYGVSVSPERPHTWRVATVEAGHGLGPRSAHPWDLAHAALCSGVGIAGADILVVEPDLEQEWPTLPAVARPASMAPGQSCQPVGEKGGVYDVGRSFGWHLDDDHSGLRAAREAVGTDGRLITVAHLDTGYDKDHEGLPVGLDIARQRNFVDNNGSAVDLSPDGGFLNNRGHGTGTIGILAGGDAGKLRGGMPIGPIGGTPESQIVPVRIANSVVHFWTSTVARGIDYARDIGADVLSMSMGGLPSAAWADAVNAAYDAGVVLVCASGNSFGGLPTSLVVYPARFNRVIAACGIMAQGHPYYGLGGPMEGCVGPASKMCTAMAAYTPNIPWLRLGCRDVVDMDGAGTSAATPQVAAAAALWLARHGGEYERGWQRVEAVRYALFKAAARPVGDGDAVPSQYFGRGLLRAGLALDERPDPASLSRTPPDSASFAFLRLISGMFGVGEASAAQAEMFRLELTQLALASRGAREAVPEPAAPGEQISSQAKQRFAKAILDEGVCSMALRDHLGGLLGHKTWTCGGPPTSRRSAPAVGRDAVGISRQIAIPQPTRRSLRVFATDPGDSNRLETSFVNVATIDVPWEDVEPGPVGEYLEVVDIDPASNAAYPPVDLQDRHALAQDGISPSEGNPQFHQQMVYAVAMRTIRNFEIALGRKALWSERRLPKNGGLFVPAPDRGYVQRLRIYPHALRERNAYYSPDRKALLFGYFDTSSSASQGRQTVFTCLSHDVVAHETTHALLDGLHRRYQESTNPDVLAFHEAFADIVAIFQHFTFPELLRYAIGHSRGDLSHATVLSDLARQFGQSLHNRRALRQAIGPGMETANSSGSRDDGDDRFLMDYRMVTEPHERGAILVAAMFEAFVAIYTRRTADLVRLASGGTGIPFAGAIHPDLVGRLAQAAVETAQRILTTAIRALDYMPPVDPTFGDYLRAVVTADADMDPDHGMGYRVAFAEAFARRGIYPLDVPSVSPDGLLWQGSVGPVQSTRLNDFLQKLSMSAYTESDRRMAFEQAKRNAAELHTWMSENLDVEMARSLGLDFKPEPGERHPTFEVHSVRPAMRTTADGERRTDIVAVVTQKRDLPVDPAGGKGQPTFVFRGGCTLLLDRGYKSQPIRYAICRPVWELDRAEIVRRHLYGAGPYGIDSIYECTADGLHPEPFAALHSNLS